MKKIVFGLLMTMGVLNAQNNLVFNRVLEMYLTTTVSATVPEGKVWKVENSSSNLLVDKPNVDYGLPLSNAPFAQGTGAINWFSENTVIKASGSSGIRISVLEFNVVPTSTGSGTGGGVVNSDGLVFEEALTMTFTRTQVISSTLDLYDQVIVPDGKILKIFQVSTFFLGSSYYQSMSNGTVFIGDELFYPNRDYAMVRFFPSGTYPVKFAYSGSAVPNRIVVNAILYSIP